MPTIYPTVTVAGHTGDGGKGQRNNENLKKIFASSPVYTDYSTTAPHKLLEPSPFTASTLALETLWACCWTLITAPSAFTRRETTSLWASTP